MKLLILIALLPGIGHGGGASRSPAPKIPVSEPSSTTRPRWWSSKATAGFEQMIQLADDEKVESLSIGDSLAWQVAPNKGGNLLFLKPVEPNAHTNLAVVSNKRSYAFELVAVNLVAETAEMNYVVRFKYPQDEEAKVQAQLAAAQHDQQQEVVPDRKLDPSAWNLDYTFQGKTELAPLHAFDDGTFTYFQFRERQDVPAIFLVTDGKNESLLNFHVSGKYVVVERIGKQFTLRSREGNVCVYNEAAFKVAPAAVARRPEPVEQAARAASPTSTEP